VSSAGPEPILADSGLIGRVRAGDPSGMVALYDRYGGIIYSVALRVLSSPQAAEDVLQEVLLQLWRNPEAFDSARGSLSAWLAVIARHRAIDHLRRRRPEDSLDSLIIAGGDDLQSEAERADAISKVRQVLGGLPANQRSAVEMAFFEGLTYPEIAARTGEPLGTIKTRIRAALAAVRKVLVK
jgi:RNA polymerase sigma-70 factor, ECF subfamily